jgi:hypothetical protein
MTNINCIKVGNMVSISIDGRLSKKNCGSVLEADELFRLVLKAKADPSDENIMAIRAALNERTRIALMVGLDAFVADPDNGQVYLAGFNTPVPDTLVEVIKEYHENNYPMTPVINFWKLLMCNPDTRVRESLFRFITKHDFVLTDSGYMVVYKAVAYKDANRKNDAVLEFEEFITNKYMYVRKWWASPNKYVVYKNADGEYAITKKRTAEHWNEKEMGIEILGNLRDLFNAIVKPGKEDENGEQSNVKKTQYTDMWSHSMTIELGVPATKERNLCDSNPNKDCSNGLHCGATGYVENYASNADAVLVCLVNPANVVAVPDSDCTKMRVSEYFPYALASYNHEKKKISIIEEAYFEEDYKSYEVEELNKLVAKIQASELPYETAQNAAEETRPMSELLKIIQNRLVDIKDVVK